MESTTPMTKKRLSGLMELSKSPGKMLLHIYDLEDKVDDAKGNQKDLMDRIDEFLKTSDKMKPVKGKDYLTDDDVNELVDKVSAKVPKQDPIDYEKINTDLVSDVMKQIKKPKDGKNGKDGIVDHDLLASKLAEHLEQAEDGEDGKDGQDGSPDTPEEVRDKLMTLPNGQRLHVKYIDGLETFPKQQDVDYQLSKARNQISYLIQAVETLRNSINPSGGGGYTFVEIPTGAIDGSNVIFTLANVPTSPGTMLLQLNGAVQFQNISGDYTISGNTITFAVGSTPSVGSTLVAYYS